MAYIGNAPTNVPLSGADIEDGTIALADLSATGTKDSTTFLRGDNTFAEAGGGKVLQVVSTLKTDTTVVSFTGTYTDISGLSVNITPSATSSKILVITHVNGGNDINSNNCYMRIMRDTTAIASGDSPSSRIAGTFQLQIPANNHTSTGSMTVLDSPSSTSQLTYKIQGETGNAGGGQININRSNSDANNESTMRATSSITVMEIGA